MIEPINPVTLRGTISNSDSTPSNLSIGRLWLSENSPDAAIGQHRHRTGIAQPSSFVKWMQFVMWQSETNPLAFMLGNEDAFIDGLMVAFADLAGGPAPKDGMFYVTGPSSRGAKDGRSCEFVRSGLAGMEFVTAIIREHERPPLTGQKHVPDGKIMHKTTMGLQHFLRGIQHLFARELTELGSHD